LKEIDHVVRNDDDIEKTLDLADREVLTKLLGIDYQICSQCRVIWKKFRGEDWNEDNVPGKRCPCRIRDTYV
jgi:hypothetical protein